MRTLAATVLVALGLLTAPASGAVATRLGLTLDATAANQLFELVNRARAANGAAPLTRDPQLDAVAGAHTLHMAGTGVLAHNDGLFTRESHRKLGIKTFAENVGYDWSVAGAHDGFMTSPLHKANLLGPAYRLAGFAAVRDGKGALWVTENFGTPRVTTTAVRPPAPRPVAPARAAVPAPPRPRTTPSRPRASAAPRPTPSKPAVVAPRPAAPRPSPPVRPATATPAPLPVVAARATPAGEPARRSPAGPIAGLAALSGLLLAVRRGRRSRA